jgi:predicted ATPase/DNA-binding CsgD family transcriptional regulator
MAGTRAAGVGGLPAETNEFVGRKAELRRIDGLLRDARLVTLVGPGGVGKTRIVLHAAEAAAPRYADGICLVELSALRDPSLLPHTIARRLGLAEQSLASQREALFAHLNDRRLLLILDTCEHLIDAVAELVEAILIVAPHVTVLTSSREPLDVDGETTLPIRPLPVTRVKGTGEEPPPFGVTVFQGGGETGGSAETDAGAKTGPSAETAGADTGGGGDAVELFARRAAAAVPGFTVTDTNRGDVIRLCQRLEGIPLAIELAAVRLRTLSVAELAGRLDRRLPLLTGGNNASDGRHKTLRDAIGWSYELCTGAERTLWARLSVFAGAFNVTAAREVCASADLDADEIFETIIRLVDKSVLTGVKPTTAGVPDENQPPWYRMLDTIHEFGGEMLSASGNEAAVRKRFVGRYLAKAQYFAEHLTDQEQLERFRELRREHSNLRAALQYTLDDERCEQVRLGAELANALYGYWHMSGLLREGRYWYLRVLDTLPASWSQERGWALANRGYLGAMQGEAAEAVADAAAGIRIGHELGDDRLIGRGYNYLTLALTIADRYDEAHAAAEEAERKLETLGDRTGLAILDCHWAHLSHLAGDPEETLRYGARAVSRFGGAKEWWASAWGYAISGMALYWEPSRDAETARVLNKSLLLKHELGDMVGTAYCLEIHGWLAARVGRHVRAAWLLGAADPLWERAGGTLGGTAALLKVHDRSIAACRAGLGQRRFESLFTRGASARHDDIVALAIADAEAPGKRVPAIPQPGKLTDAEWEIAHSAAAGLSAEQIARQLYLSTSTVERQLASVFGKLGVTSADQLGSWFDGRGPTRPTTPPGNASECRLDRATADRSRQEFPRWPIGGLAGFPGWPGRCRSGRFAASRRRPSRRRPGPGRPDHPFPSA